jgi:superfamily II DNA or RNA helicase
MKTKVVSRELKTTNHALDFRLHCAALEWSLAEPIIIQSAEDIKSSADWKDRVQPFHHQVQNLMRFCRRLPVTLLADDVGLGKTISAGLIVSELMKRNRISKILVVCPKLLIDQWVDELGSKFGIQAYGATGSDLKGSVRRQEPVIVTTYHSATGFLLDGEAVGFDMLILDEAHKVRNLHGSQSVPRMAKAIFDALEQRTFKYVLMLTATPIQNRLWDVYSLVDCLAVARGHTNPFGTPTQFASRFIADGKQIARRLRPENAAEFRRIVGSYMFRTRRVDAKLAFPERKVTSCSVDATQEEIQIQSTLADFITGFNALEQVGLLVALMSSPQALSQQVSNMARKGTAPAQLASRIQALAASVVRPAKVRQLLQISAELRKKSEDWRMVVFTTRRETQEMIGKVLDTEGISHGFIRGGQPLENRKTIERFWKEKPAIHVVVSTDAGAEGVNLQAANVLVNYDLPWNPMIVEQRIGRVQRIGSRFATVQVSNIVHRNSPEQRIVVRLMEKLQVIAHTVGDIEAVLEAAGDAEGTTLEQQIREMVIASLRGQDSSKAARLAEESIDQAKKLLEEQQEQMNSMLGEMKESEQADLPMPRLELSKPSMPLEDFVLSALSREGYQTSSNGKGLYFGRKPNNDDLQFTFDPQVMDRHTRPGVFMGRVPQLYQPGKAAFERLVQRWIDHGAAHGEDKRCRKDEAVEIAKRWVNRMTEALFVSCTTVEGKGSVNGQIHCLTRAANAVDSYDKIIKIPISSSLETWKSIRDSNAYLQPRELIPKLDSTIESCALGDFDIQKFRNFYEARLKSELQRSDSGARREKLVNDLSPSVTVEPAALEYTISGLLVVDVVFVIGGSSEYRSKIAIEEGLVKSEPKWVKCELTSALLPEDCLETCSVTGKRGLRHRMQKSEVGGGYALPDYCVTCSLTGKRILKTESEACCITGKIACRSKLERSEISGRYVIPKRAKNCELTGVTVVEDELVRSSVTGKWFRSDMAVLLADGVSPAYRGEVKRCAFSKVLIPPSDMAVSAFSGKTMSKSRVVRSDVSSRECDPSELKKCEESGQSVLPDEIVQCGVSGKWICKDLAAVCPETKMLASKSKFLVCNKTKDMVLPAGLGRCCVSRKRVRKSLLAASAASGRTAVASKMVRCEETGVQLFADEVGRCGVSGKSVDLRLLGRCVITKRYALKSELVKSELSGAWMLPEHAGRCEESGMILHPNELVQCAVSGKPIRSDLTAVCEETNERASKSAFSICEMSNCAVLPAGLGHCCITGKRVRKSLLTASAVSGRMALDSAVLSCEETGIILIPDEAGRCEVSGRRVDLRLLQRCVVTKLTCLKSELVKSDLTGAWMRPVHALLLADGRSAGRHESAECQWSGKILPTEASAECSLCGVRLDKKLLNASGEFAVLREVLDGKRAGEAFPDPGYLARTCPEIFQGLHGCDYLSSPSKRAHILFGVKSVLVLYRRIFAVLTVGEMSGMKPAGRALFGKKTGGIWIATESKEIR